VLAAGRHVATEQIYEDDEEEYGERIFKVYLLRNSENGSSRLYD